MNRRLILRAIFFVLLGATLLWAGDPWKDKPWTEWTENEVRTVLTNSPWAKEARVPRATVRSRQVDVPPVVVNPHSRPELTPPGSVPYREPRVVVPGSITIGTTTWAHPGLDVRWASALTVRQAIARRFQLRRSGDDEYVKQLLSWQPTHYVLTVLSAEIPPELSQRWNEALAKGEDERARVVKEMREYMASHFPAGLTEATVRQSAYLQPVRSGQKVSPETVVFQMQTVPLQVHMYFPLEVNRKPTISANEEEVKFIWRLRDIDIDVDFDLRTMVRDGRPDL